MKTDACKDMMRECVTAYTKYEGADAVPPPHTTIVSARRLYPMLSMVATIGPPNPVTRVSCTRSISVCCRFREPC